MRIAAAGARVAICGRDPAKLAKAKKTIDDATGTDSTVAIAADLTKAGDIETLFAGALEQLGHLDILVVNSGHMAYGTVEDLDDAAWYEALELVLMSAVRLTRLAVPHMRNRKTGDIVYITAAGTREPAAHLILSNAFRAGIAALAKTLSHAVARDNIRVNVLAPGYFDTGRVRRRIDEMSARENISRPEAAQRIGGDIPIGRIGEADEFGALVAFVVGRDAPFLTGSTIVMDGGSSRNSL
jgi:3-oxoacyl-[acyl-carrier protein] reductase